MPLLQVSKQIAYRGLPLIIESDASGMGWGAVLDSHWLSGRWPLKMQNSNIEILESLAAVNVWKPKLKEAKYGVLLKLDNKPAMHSLRNGHSRNEEVRKILKIIACQLSDLQVIWKTIYINTKKNIFADFLSREPEKDFVKFAKRQHGRKFNIKKDRFTGLKIDENLKISLPEMDWGKIIKLN